ncbi:MAG TPA: hypothetical protein VET23_05385 [Chitinophagaceae bacterium]|nr:hypothetical protein [Chitinophagaceae bacterium]
MEVHAHTHTVPIAIGRKRFTHYLWEFLMLFLAVFCGFLAENLREHAINREIERNNMKSFLRNLREDSVQLNKSIEVNEKRFRYLDTLIKLKSREAEDGDFKNEFVYYSLKVGFLNYFTSNQSNFRQMQSSGSLRLIRKSGVLDSILNYETRYEQIKHQEDICMNWWYKAIEQDCILTDITPLANLEANKLWEVTLPELKNINLPKISNQPFAFQQYFNWRVNERIALGYYIQYLQDEFSYLQKLIPFLKKEYHLE